MPTWAVLFDDGALLDIDKPIILKNLVPENDPVEWTHEILKYPTAILGRPISRLFPEGTFAGYIFDTDLDHRGNQLWGVRYADGDTADYHANEIFDLLSSHERPAPMTGARVAKKFSSTVHYGTITGTTTETITGDTLWTILYDDGDDEDFDMYELVEAIQLYATKLQSLIQQY
jgi:hypothetical protein